MDGKVMCSLCGEWVYPIYGGDCPNCGEEIPDFDADEYYGTDDEDEEFGNEESDSDENYDDMDGDEEDW